MLYYRENRNRTPFIKLDFQEHGRNAINKVIREIQTLSDEIILNTTEKDLIEQIFRKYCIETPTIHFNDTNVYKKNEEIPAERFPRGYNVREWKTYPKPVVYHEIPVSGDVDILNYHGKTFSISWVPGDASLSLSDNIISVRIVLYNNIDENTKHYISENYNKVEEYLRKGLSEITGTIEEFHIKLKEKIEEVIKQKKKKIDEEDNLLASLNKPIKKEKWSTESTIYTPKIKQKIKLSNKTYKPGSKPHPVLNTESYKGILAIIDQIGKVFESLPSTYKGKGEEDLRDHIIMALEPATDGETTGETFNKEGKTDILIRKDKGVVFVAECKFRSWEKWYHSTIDQLLWYLTRQNTKNTIIIFVKKKNISSVLDKIKETTPRHKNYISLTSTPKDNWFQYKFHLNNDIKIELEITVLVYHIPE